MFEYVLHFNVEIKAVSHAYSFNSHSALLFSMCVMEEVIK